jgi:NAD(P)-dependent dehydrogenase (short-subunit alcohol dehydrogenase family)
VRKTCIVTGGASGIGREVVERLRRLGYRVAVIDRQPFGGDAGDLHAIEADLTDPNAADAAFASCAAALGNVDAAVNAAGVFGAMAPIEGLSDAQVEQVTFGNIRMCLHAMRAELRLMRAASAGRIINIASVAGSHGIIYKGDYCAAKHAIVGLTKTAALETVKQGIAVNSVSPGFVDTPMTASAIRENALLEGFITKQTPLGRSLAPSSVAGLVSWLVAEAPVEITGSDYVIDGCYSAR